MHTKCPHCETRFRIRAEQLRAAQGQTRCSRCSKIFNALEHLQTSPVSEEEARDEWPATLMLEPDPAETEIEDLPEEPAPKPDPDPDEDPLGEYEAPETIFPEQEQALPFEVPDNLPPIEAAKPKPKKKRRGTFIWTLGILLLLGAALVQLAWLGRDTLIQYPEGRGLLETLCGYADCTLPQRRAPGEIEVLKRVISAHPETEKALLIQITIVNRASFAQSYPVLQLGLYSRDEKLVARRHFLPDQYLGRELDPSILLRPDEALSLEMAIEDPGENVTGFKLEFF
jgi:predicted Zn finger-like uncharacterized protein